jgi:hypothetical protein
MLWAVIFAAGFLIGLLVGRWWSLVVPAAFAGWTWVESLQPVAPELEPARS